MTEFKFVIWGGKSVVLRPEISFYDDASGASNEYPQHVFLWRTSDNYPRIITKYNRTSMARTSLGPWKFVRDMGSSSFWGLILALGQEANGE